MRHGRPATPESLQRSRHDLPRRSLPSGNLAGCRAFPRRLVQLAAVLLGWGLATNAWAGDIDFLEVSDLAGIQPSQMEHGKSGSVLAVDFDDDGDIDLFVPNSGGVANQLYRNRGDGTFDEIGVAAGLASTGRSRTAIWFDFDGDHRLDLFTASDCWEADADCPDTTTLKLYRQASDAQFVDVTVAADIPDDTITDTMAHRGGIAAGDINNDGYLDLIFGLWSGGITLLLNDGDGTFTDISASAGMPSFGYHWQPTFHDWNGDGWLDIHYVTDFSPNHLWINQGDNTFVDVAATAGVDNAWNDMGQSLGDYDNDGDLDIYVTNITTSTRNNILFRNDSTAGGLQFTRVSFEAGVAQGGWGWGCTFFDADNDGDLDLAATNGWFSGLAHDDASVFYRNEGGEPVTFSDASASAGLDDTYWGSSLNALDYDRDGDLDLVQSCNGSGIQPHRMRLIENETTTGNHYLVVRPRMAGANYRAIGAIIRIEVGGVSHMRLITAGISAFGQEPAEAFFGLGTATLVDRVVIEWPNGRRTELEDVAADQILDVQDVLFADGFESGDLSAWTLPGAGAELATDLPTTIP